MNDVDQKIGKKVAKGAAWIASTKLIIRLAGLLNTLILARILMPDDFGVVAIGIMAMQLLQNISEIGVSYAVVRYRDATRDHYNTLFTLSLIKGVFVLCLMLASAGWISAFYQDDRLVSIFVALGAVSFVHSLINPKYYEFERELDFSKEFWVEILNKGARVSVSISLAVLTQSHWAIIFGMAAGISVHIGLSYLLRPFLPRISLAKFQDLIGFTGWLTGASILVALNNKTAPLILGKIFGPMQNGLYYVGDQLSYMPSAELASPVARAIYPGLSEMQSEPGKMREAFLKGASAIAAISLPAGVGCAFVAPDLVTVILGDRWRDLVPVVQTLAPAYAVQSIYAATTGYAMARGMTKALFIRELVALIVSKSILIWAALQYGFGAAVIAVAATTLLYAVFQARLYRFLSDGNMFDPILSSWRSFAALGGMSIYFWILRPMLPMMDDFMPVIRLIFDVLCGAFLFVTTQYGLWILSGKPLGIEKTISELVAKRVV